MSEPAPATARLPGPGASGHAGVGRDAWRLLWAQGERLRLNPNCCYQACAACTSRQRLREFRARFPHDWESRLDGSARLLLVARECP